jgi:hypothetical protein
MIVTSVVPWPLSLKSRNRVRLVIEVEMIEAKIRFVVFCTTVGKERLELYLRIFTDMWSEDVRCLKIEKFF